MAWCGMDVQEWADGKDHSSAFAAWAGLCGKEQQPLNRSKAELQEIENQLL